MAGVIQVGGLATGLDTNKIVDQLVALERRPIDLLQQQEAAVQDSQAAFASFGGKLAALRTAADALASVDSVLVGKASSSNESAVTAVAGSGASRGTVTVGVTALARGSVASASTGLPSATGTVATGTGSFKFQVGSGEVQTVGLTAATTLQDLVNGINDKSAGVTASAVNLGTAAAPDYRLNIVSRATGESSTIAIVQDDTTLAVDTTQTGHNAEFTVSGFSGTFARETNTFSDVLTGVSFTLKDTGTSTITVNDDADEIAKRVQTLVGAFNDVVSFVAGESAVTRTGSGTAGVGTLTANSTVRRIVDQLHEALSGALAGATTQYVNLSSVGLATRAKDEVSTVGGKTVTQVAGTLSFDEAKFRAALADDATAVGQVFGGNGSGAGAANALSDVIANATGIDGSLTIDTRGFDDRLTELADQIDAGQRHLDQFATDLRAQFTALETLVSGLQSQGSLLTAALRNL